jgi:D-alanyl-D-alanine carboxypeptidase
MELWTFRRALLILFAALLSGVARGQTGDALPPEMRTAVDQAAREVLAATGVPSASVAIVRDGRLEYARAYGNARLEPPLPAQSPMRYAIGSISKQFTAAAVLLLAEEKKLSLDDPVGRFLPELTRAREVTIREILSHTSGYRDYWPQDYVPPFMLQPITAEALLSRWARAPLDFEPGTQYQYSNTGYVIAGRIVEKAGGTPLIELLRRRVFAPLQMESVVDVDASRLAEPDPVGYLRYALGPPRPAPKEGKGWLYAAGELAMTASDLAKWNLAVIEKRILSPASWREMQTEVRLKSGLGTQYGLGIGVTSRDGHRVLSHGGEVSGFTATNTILPDDRAAVTVLTNLDSASASGTIAARITGALIATPVADAAAARSRQLFEGLQSGKLDRSLLTPNANAYFTDEAVRDFAASLGPLGKIVEFRPTAQRERGGMTFRGYEVKLAAKSVNVLERDLPDGRIEQFQVSARE